MLVATFYSYLLYMSLYQPIIELLKAVTVKCADNNTGGTMQSHLWSIITEFYTHKHTT